MGKQVDGTSDPGRIQVFELTMDNPEDQVELNRRLQKPGEHDVSPSKKLGRTEPRDTVTESSESQKGIS